MKYTVNRYFSAFAVALTVLATGCVSHASLRPGCYAQGRLADTRVYPPHRTAETPRGIALDVPAGVDPLRVDRIVDSLDACMLRAFPGGDMSSADGRAICRRWHIDRKCMTVLVPAKTTTSCDGKHQLLYDRVPESACLAKGLEPDPACPCRLRSFVQDGGWTAVATPNLELLAQAVARIGGCSDIGNPWADQRIADCMAAATRE